jgi:hypothetical protein
MMIATALLDPDRPFELNDGEMDTPVLIKIFFDATGTGAVFSRAEGSRSEL